MDQAWRNQRLIGELFLLLLDEFIIVQHAVTTEAIDPMQL